MRFYFYRGRATQRRRGTNEEDNAADRLLNFLPLRSRGGLQLRRGPRSLEKHISSEGTRGVVADLPFRFGTSSLLDFKDERVEDNLKGLVGFADAPGL